MKSQVMHPLSPLQTTVLFLLVLLGQSPRVQMVPYNPMVYLHMMGNPEWKTTMLQLQASLRGPGGDQEIDLQPWDLITDRPDELLNKVKEVLGLGEREIMKSHKREQLEWRPMGVFSENHIASLPYSPGGDIEEGREERNEALTSIAGGLQAFNRQKGGFGFRFG